MKNTILWSALFTLIGTQVHADLTQPAAPPSQAPNMQQNKPVTPTPSGQSLPSVPTTQPPPTAAINCEYKIPPETKQINKSLIITWAQKAVTQAFDFDPNQLDAQLQKLQPCFTEQGWTGFNTALQKSGNLEAIKSQNLTVSSQVMGQIVVTETKENQWKITLPVQVVYQNDKEKVTQSLNVDLTISRKITGELGIVQMIAVPFGTVTQDAPPNPADNPMNPSVPGGVVHTSPKAKPPTSDTPPTQPPAPTTPSGQPTPATPGQPTLPENRATQPTLPANQP